MILDTNQQLDRKSHVSLTNHPCPSHTLYKPAKAELFFIDVLAVTACIASYPGSWEMRNGRSAVRAEDVEQRIFSAHDDFLIARDPTRNPEAARLAWKLGFPLFAVAVGMRSSWEIWWHFLCGAGSVTAKFCEGVGSGAGEVEARPEGVIVLSEEEREV
ncbi:unnamed protein product [Tuber aestivum]|uniref:Uncharacterized protein n=1 Tax=Tuber aestivum TaxID=59557 RepID=A0A292PMQ5_9PEZI|nr:unnamed protein product [Tuber aestivum]